MPLAVKSSHSSALQREREEEEEEEEGELSERTELGSDAQSAA